MLQRDGWPDLTFAFHNRDRLQIGGFVRRRATMGGEVIMAAIVEDKLDAIVALCRKYGVARLDVFGSALRDDFRPGDSDIDLLVDFGQMDPYRKVDAYFDMLDELSELLGIEVDLVMVGALKNPYIAADVHATKRLLYAA